MTGFVLIQYYSVDVLSSLLAVYADCDPDWHINIGRHCFSDYVLEVSYGLRANPWDYLMSQPWDSHHPGYNNYPAAAMIPLMPFGLLGKWLGAQRLGLLCYLLVLTIAVFTPAVWAARGARGLERIVVFVACGVVAVPAWAVIDRGNSAGFIAPIALAFLVALCRQRWGRVTILVVLAALVKPQFAVLAVVLFAARQWRLGGLALAGAAVGNIAAYLLWPRDFPKTILRSARSIFGYDSSNFDALSSISNVSFSKALIAPIPLIGYAALVLVVVSVLALGRRIPPVMVGIVLLITACLAPALSNRYYLVFALPIAALVVRDPDGLPGSGIFDRLATVAGRHRKVGICVSLATALTIAQIALPHPPVSVVLHENGGTVTTLMVLSTAVLTPILWLVTCAVIIVSYARRPASAASTGAATATTSREPTSAVTP